MFSSKSLIVSGLTFRSLIHFEFIFSNLFFLKVEQPKCPSTDKWIFYFLFFLAVLGLRFCARAFSSCGKQGPLFIVVRGPLTVVVSLVVEHRLQTHRLSSFGSRA